MLVGGKEDVIMIKSSKGASFKPYVDLLKLDKESRVVILPNKIIFLLDVSEYETNELIEKEKKELLKKMEKEKCEADKSPIANITFLPTFDCNLRCIYCYAKGGEEKIYLTEKLTKASINAIAAKTKASEINIYFAGGGEPFLNFDIMKFAVDYSKDLFHTVNLGLVTNGTFNSEQLQWIINNNVDLRISFDGLAQDYQRPPAVPFKKIIIKNIKSLSEFNYDFMVQCIITSKNVNNMVENVKYFSELGIKYLKIEPVHISEICRGDKSLIPKPIDFVYNFIQVLKFIAENDLDIKIDSSFISRPTTGYYCGISDPNINITPEGYITACVEVARKTDPFSDILLYGKCLVDEEKFIFNDISITKLKKLHFSNYENCNKCNLKLICKGGCPIRNIFDNGFSFKPSKYTCQIEKNLIPQIFLLVKSNPKYCKIIFEDFKIKIC